MIHLMLDLETLGVGGNCAILSAAIVPFNINTGEMFLDESFYERINKDHSLNEGFTTKQSTLDFWNRQPKAIRDREFGGTLTIAEFCDLMIAYFKAVKKKYGKFEIWCSAAKLDFGGLYNLFLHVGKDFPIPYTAERCTRTIRSLTKDVYVKPAGTENNHHPIDDCKNQINDLVAQFKLIKI